jgi:16S rRNA (uracil1498-N3)-methyltransferase
VRLFCRPLPSAGEGVLPEATAHHARVLRIAVGDRLRLFDGLGDECDADVIDAGFGCRFGAHERIEARARRVTLVLALPKGKKLDTIVRMVTELGVHAIHLVITERTVARPDAERGEHRVERLQRIAEEACAQSQQTHAPVIHAPTSLSQACGVAPTEAWKVVFWEESTTALDDICPAARDVLPEDAWLVIGPEGGLSAHEIEELATVGFAHASLGPTVLRVDTAAVIAVGAVLDRLGLLCR